MTTRWQEYLQLKEAEAKVNALKGWRRCVGTRLVKIAQDHDGRVLGHRRLGRAQPANVLQLPRNVTRCYYLHN